MTVARATPAPESAPPSTLAGEIAALQRLTTGELRERYAQLFGEQPRSWNK